MKTQRKSVRKINPIATGRWAAYSAAAAASTLAAVQSADAAIHYSGPINQKVDGLNRFSFPLEGGANIVVAHNFYVYGSSSVKDGGNAFFFIDAAAGSVAGNYVTCASNKDSASVTKLQPRDPISAQAFVPDGGILATSYGAACGFKDRGHFMDRGVGFVGFKFNNGAGDQYGWARLQIKGTANNTFKLVDYAYGDPGDTITAGEKSGGSSSRPALESLAALALGGAGLVAWRRCR